MILYFSATGNGKYIAEQIAKKLMIKLYLQWIVLGIGNIKLKRGGDFTKKKLPKFVAAFMYATERKTKNLSVNKDLCIGCKLCEKKCPVGAIRLKMKSKGYPFP